MANAHLTKLHYFEQFQIRSEGDLVNLNDLYAAAGSPANQDPRRWNATEEAKQLIEQLAKNLNVANNDIYHSRRGRHGGGTWAHKVLAVEYAGYLSAEFKVRVNDTFLRVQEGDDSVIDEAFANQTLEKQKRTAARIQSKAIRNQHTETLKAHQVTAQGYGLCTNATYKPLLGGTANDVRKARNLPAKANVREHLSLKEIAAVMFSEALADEIIIEKNLLGDRLCSKACFDASVKVASIM